MTERVPVKGNCVDTDSYVGPSLVTETLSWLLVS